MASRKLGAKFVSISSVTLQCARFCCTLGVDTASQLVTPILKKLPHLGGMTELLYNIDSDIAILEVKKGIVAE